MALLERVKSWALDYHHRTSRLPQGRRVTASLARQIGRADSLLDVGCGDGVNAKRIAELIGATRLEGVDVVVRPTAQIPVKQYDGLHLPFRDGEFQAVVLVDVLHHCDEPLQVLKEALRVASKVVALKDHFVFGAFTRKALHYMDLAGNAKDGIACPGVYFEPHQWVDLIGRAGGRICGLEWPLNTHDMPWRAAMWPQLQFTMRVEPTK